MNRLLALKIAATIASLICGGCIPQMSVTPQPAEPVKHELTIKVEGGADVKVGGDATITAKAAPPSQSPTLCPCCGSTGACRGLCGKDGCDCSRGSTSAAPTAGNVVALPQFTTQYRDRVVCENGICRTIREEVRVPTASAAKRSVAPMTQGEITIYDNGSAAGRAMRDAIGSKGVEWKNSAPPIAINGYRWSPTAIKPDGSAWTPGANGWHAGSLSQFLEWASR